MEPNWTLSEWSWDPVSLSAQPISLGKGSHIPLPCDPAALPAGLYMVGHTTPVLGGLSQALQPLKLKALAEPPPKKTAHKPCCQVPGCTADLQNSRAYYRRYRICENHFRMSTFSLPSILNGATCRFCQQCAKFEPITEFEGDKRSCRRQLSRHNERRKGRKLQAAKDANAKHAAEAAAGSGAEDGDNSGDSNSGRLVEGPLADLLQSSSIQRSSAGATVYADNADNHSGTHQTVPLGTASTMQLTGSAQQGLPGEGAPTVRVEAVDVPGQQQAWQEVNTVPRTSPHTTVSEVSVEAGQPGRMDCDDGFDAILTMAAQDLLAHWQQEEEHTPAGTTAAQGPCAEAAASSDGRQLLPTASAAVRGSHTLSSTSQQPVLAKALAAVDAAAAAAQVHSQGPQRVEPPSADSSVHGPLPTTLLDMSQHGPSAQMERVLSVLGQSQQFDTIRADNKPLVRDMHAPAVPQYPSMHSGAPASQAPPPVVELPHHMVHRVAAMEMHGTAALHHAAAAFHLPPDHAGYRTHMLKLEPVSGYTGSPPQSGSLLAPMPPPQMGTSPPASGGMGTSPGATHPLPGSPSAAGHTAPWLAAHWNAVAASLRPADNQSSGASNGTAMHDLGLQAHWQHMNSLARVHSSEPSAQSFSPQPQVPLHPLLASLPAAKDTASQPPAAPSATAATQQYSPSYPNIWSTPSVLPATAPAPPALPHSASTAGLNFMSHANGAPWMGAPQGPANLSRLSAHSVALEPPPGCVPNPGNLTRNLSQANYILAEQSLTRLSIKLHGVTPEALPPELRSALTEWLAATDVRLLQGFIRPGCVHLSLDCMVVASSDSCDSSSIIGGSAGSSSTCGVGYKGLDHLLQAGLATAGVAHMASALPRPLARLFSSCTIVELQSPSKLVLMEGEAVWSVTALEKRPTLPVLNTVQPLAILAGSRTPTYLYLQGSHLEGRGASTDPSAAGCQALVRSQGKFFQQGNAQAVQPVQGAEAAGSAGDSSKAGWWRVSVDAASMQPGLAVVECQAGRLLSNWRPVLVVDDVGVHREILQLQPLQAQHLDKVTSIVTDLALLLQLNHHHTSTTAVAPQHAMGVWVHARRGVNEVESDTESEDLEGGSSDLVSDYDEEDDQEVTAPSVSEGPEEYVEEGDEEVQGRFMPAAAEPGDDHLMEGDGPAVHGAIAMVGARSNATRMVSWDSEAFAAVGTPAVHSSWGSTMHTSVLARADVDMAVVGGARLPAREQDDLTSLSVQGVALPVHRRAEVQQPAAAAMDPFTPEVRTSLAAKALRLLAFACDAGWPCTARLLLDLLTNLPLVAPAALAGQPISALTVGQLVPLSAQDVLATSVAGDGLTPLHRAARSGSAATVREVLSFARSAALFLNPASRGAASLSPLHLAASCPDNEGAAALTLLHEVQDAPVQWFVARCQDGRTPAQLAAATDACRHVNAHARYLVHQLAARPSTKRP